MILIIVSSLFILSNSFRAHKPILPKGKQHFINLITNIRVIKIYILLLTVVRGDLILYTMTEDTKTRLKNDTQKKFKQIINHQKVILEELKEIRNTDMNEFKALRSSISDESNTYRKEMKSVKDSIDQLRYEFKIKSYIFYVLFLGLYLMMPWFKVLLTYLEQLYK